MKKTLLYLLLLLSFNSMAQVAKVKPHVNNNSNSLTIIGEYNQNFWLFIDDVLQNENPVNSIKVNGFDAKDYYVRIEIDNQLHNCFGQFVNINRNQMYKIGRKDNLYGMGIDNTVNPRPQLTMNLLIGNNAPEIVQNQNSNYFPPQNGMVPPQNGGQFVPQPAPGLEMEMGFGMNPYEFEEVKAMIEHESFDNTRLTIAKQVADGNRLSASQITAICQLFSFENHALEFAKYAYPSCIDQNRYYLVNQAFKYDSSKRELNELITGHN